LVVISIATPRELELNVIRFADCRDISKVGCEIEKSRGLAAISFRVTIRFLFTVETTKDIVLGRQIHVSADEEIEHKPSRS